MIAMLTLADAETIPPFIGWLHSGKSTIDEHLADEVTEKSMLHRCPDGVNSIAKRLDKPRILHSHIFHDGTVNATVYYFRHTTWN